MYKSYTYANMIIITHILKIIPKQIQDFKNYQKT